MLGNEGKESRRFWLSVSPNVSPFVWLDVACRRTGIRNSPRPLVMPAAIPDQRIYNEIYNKRFSNNIIRPSVL